MAVLVFVCMWNWPVGSFEDLYVHSKHEHASSTASCGAIFGRMNWQPRSKKCSKRNFRRALQHQKARMLPQLHGKPKWPCCMLKPWGRHSRSSMRLKPFASGTGRPLRTRWKRTWQGLWLGPVGTVSKRARSILKVFLGLFMSVLLRRNSAGFNPIKFLA